jgi:tetratricopeptide (TPR) repeat protein
VKLHTLSAAAVLATLPAPCAWGQGNPAPSKDGDPAQVLVTQATKLIDQGKLAEALKTFERASALDPGNEPAQIGQYISLVKLNRKEDAARVLDHWVEAKPADPRRWLCKGMAEAQTGQPEKALKSFDKLIELQPREGANWVGKGQVLQALKRDEEALQAFDQAVALSPKHEAAWNNRGGVLLRLGKYDEAIRSLDRAVELRPAWAESWYDRACAYALKGDKDHALADLKKALELKPALRAHAAADADFKSLRDDPEFKKVTEPGPTPGAPKGSQR